MIPQNHPFDKDYNLIKNIKKISEPYNAEKSRPRGHKATTTADLLAGIQFLKNLSDHYTKRAQ